VVAPNGIGKDAFWSACVEGRSGIGRISAFDASSFPIKVAGEVKDYDPTHFLPDGYRKSMKIMGRAARFGLWLVWPSNSSLQADRENPETIGVCMGSGLVPIDMAEILPLLRESLTTTVSLT
jgi:3-oxoacyl-[acyl-carrier-protein] synthase II